MWGEYDDIQELSGYGGAATTDKHPKCTGYRNEISGEYECGYETSIDCDDCKYGAGRKNPEAGCNR